MKIIIFTMFFLSSVSNAQVAELDKRCEEDSVDVSGAIGRNDWALKCNTISNRTWDYNMNDDNGKQRGRPFYPSFSNPVKFTDWWAAPKTKSAGCEAAKIKKYSRIISCTASCYTPDQEVLFEDGYESIYSAFQKRNSRIVTLSDDSSLDNLSYTVRNLKSYTESIRDVEHDIYHIKTEDGGYLKVTNNHPILISTGVMMEAEKLERGHSLIKQNGEFDKVVSIEVKKYFGKVYNVKPDANTLNGQIVVAQGYLNGSSWYQNTGAMYANRLVLRDSVPDHLL